MNMKDSLFLLIPNVSRRGCGTGRGPTNDDEGFFVSADFKCFRKDVWGWGGGPVRMMKDSLFLLIYSYQGAPQTTSLQCFFCYLMAVEPFLSQIFVD